MTTKTKKYNRRIVTALFAGRRIPEPAFEHRFYPPRRWRFDLAWPDHKIALEVQGGIWTRGRHTRGAALLKEWEKLNTAACDGWRILYCQPDDLLKAETTTTIYRALNGC
jgi:hypothetical protein